MDDAANPVAAVSCALCDTSQLVPIGSEAEYELVLGGPCPTRLVCDDCSARLVGARHTGRVANPRGVVETLQERYGRASGWVSPETLAALIDETRGYLSSREARDGMDFPTWQKMIELGMRR